MRLNRGVVAAAILAWGMATPALGATYREVDRWAMNDVGGTGPLRGERGHNGKYFNVTRVTSPCHSATCFRFNGSTSWARVTDFADLDYTETTKEYGVLIHFKRDGFAQAGLSDKLFVRGTPNSSIGWALEQRTGLDGQIRACFSVRGSLGNILGLCSQPLNGVALYDIQGWIVPSSRTVEIWINGALHNRGFRTIGTVVSDKGLTICRQYGNATAYCHGTMDDVSILKEN